jgi:carboxymethylenebutenolidase
MDRFMGNITHIAHNKTHFPAYHAVAETRGNGGGIILIHAVWGLTQHIRTVADRLSHEGFAVIAPDLLSDTSGIEGRIHQGMLAELNDPATKDSAMRKMHEVLSPIQTPEFSGETMEKLAHCHAYLDGYHDIHRIGVMGFSFGGTYAFDYAMKNPDLDAAVVFYGRPPRDTAAMVTIACPVIAFYGDRDTEPVARLPDIARVMSESGKTFEYHVYPGAGDAFFNDTNEATYDAAAARDAWDRTIGFLTKSLTADGVDGSRP